MSARALVTLASLLGALSSSGAHADEVRYDHRGSLGVIATGAIGWKDTTGAFEQTGIVIPTTLGATMAVGYAGNEVIAEAIGTFLGKKPDWGVAAGYRAYFGVGDERFKTFVSLEAAAHFTPFFTLGARPSLGVQYEVTSIFGILGGITADLGASNQGLRFTAEGFVGIQLRSYLLE